MKYAQNSLFKKNEGAQNKTKNASQKIEETGY
jgi:hypothetical protein